MDVLDGMRTFVAVIEAGSFARAADRLDRSPQLVSKYVAQLEARLGTRLLNRSTRRLSITEAGQAYFDRCVQVLADIDEMERAVADMTTQARGKLRINAPMSFGITHLSRAIAAFQREQPEVHVDLTLNDRAVDIISEGFDLAIRIARLADSALVARRLARIRLVACASPGYLDRHGAPREPADLAAHNCLQYAYWTDGSRWRFERDGESHVVDGRGTLAANNGDALRAAAVADVGVVVLPTFIVGNELRSGRLVRILPEYEIPGLAVYAVYAHRQFLSAKVRTFVDHLSGFFGDPPYWDQGLDDGLRQT